MHLTPKDVARRIRHDLRDVFGSQVRFSVRSERGAVTIIWTDGPMPWMVEAIASGYRGGGFDGMTDFEYRNDIFVDGQRATTAVRYVFARRDLSRGLWGRVARSHDLDPDSLDDSPTVRYRAAGRCNANIWIAWQTNFVGPRSVADEAPLSHGGTVAPSRSPGPRGTWSCFAWCRGCGSAARVSSPTAHSLATLMWAWLSFVAPIA
jgi:hypothetical protein